MALTDCSLITNETIDCANSVGGIKAIYITELGNKSSITSSSGTITAFTLTSGKKFWQYELEKNNAELKVKGIRSVDAGTLFYESELTFTLKKMSAQKQNNLSNLMQNRLMVITLDKNGVYFLHGELNGMDLSTMEGGSGKAAGDMNGYTLTLTGQEEAQARVVTTGLIAALLVNA